MHKQAKKHSQAPAVIAWLLMPLIGITMLLLTILLAVVVVGETDADLNGVRVTIIMGISGVILLAILAIFLRKFQKFIFIKHLVIGLCIGIGLYAYILIGGLGSYIFSNLSYTNPLVSRCTNLQDQIAKVQTSTIPLATDKGTGTAFAVGNPNTLLTAYHVIEGANKIYANYTSGEIPISVISTAPEFDIALLKIEQPASGFVNLSDKYSLADSVYGFGYPGNTYSAGQASLSGGLLSRIISNEDLKLNSPTAPLGLEIIQTDAALNPGNSGGALFNKCGVVGIISSKSDSRELQEYGLVSEEGISFAISSKTAATRFTLPISAE